MSEELTVLRAALSGLLPYVEAARLREESQAAAGEIMRMPVRSAVRKANEALALIDHLEADGGVEVMRERCAVLVENWNGSTRDADTLHIATAIRELPPSALPVLGVGR